MDTLIKVEPNANIPALSPGDTVKVSIKIVEGERVRNQIFQGVVIKVKKGGANRGTRDKTKAGEKRGES